MTRSMSDIHIAIMGVTGAGKSSLISLLCDQKIEIGHDLKACTRNVDVYSCTLYPKQTIYLIDTPGFDDTNRSDTEVLREIASWLTDSYANDVKLNGIIYLHRISDIRMQGSAKKNLVLFKKLCGEDALKNVVLATSMWDKVAPHEAQKREDQLKNTPEFWGWMMSKGSKTYRHNNTKESARDLLKHFLPMDKTILALQDDMVNKHKTLGETGAGRELEYELAKEREKFARDLLEARAQMREAMKQRDQDSIEAIRELQNEYEAHMRRLEKDREELKVSMEKLHQEHYNQLEAKMEAHQEKMMETQEEKRRIQEEKHRIEIEALQEQHKRSLERAEAAIAELKVSRSREQDHESLSKNPSRPHPSPPQSTSPAAEAVFAQDGHCRSQNSLSLAEPLIPTKDPSIQAAAENGHEASRAPLPTIRFFPHQEIRNGRQSFDFPPVSRTLPSEHSIIRVGRYSEREGIPDANPTTPSDAHVGFKSKVVSRKHCEFFFFYGQWHIKDVASSSGTFLNHVRLSPPNTESMLFPILDGDIVQLGSDFRGGEEMIFRCISIRIECNGA
jgi:small GTP-binding protein